MEKDLARAIERQRYLAEQSNIDELTGIPNRRAGKERLAELIIEAREASKNLVVTLCDVNSLKEVNDLYGRSEGDHLLQYLSDIVSGQLEEGDLFFRLSGDEFIIAFYEENFKKARGRIQEMLSLWERGRETEGIHYEASFSYGMVMVYPADQYTVSDIISKADVQMYLQKRSYHIKKAQQTLKSQPNREGQAAFDYDKEHLYDALISSTDDYIFIGNMKTGIFRYPPAMVREFGLPGEIVVNAAAFWGKLIHPHDERAFLESNQEIADGRAEYHNIEYRAKNVRDEWIWLRCRGRMIRDEEGVPSLFAGMITNLGKNSQIDHMTGLYNRFEFEGKVKKYLVDNKAANQLGFMLLDMDSFKNINDLYNRSFGDEVLRVTAQKISSLLPANADVYRMDGDEFAILIVNETPGQAAEIFERIQKAFQMQQEHGGRKYFCTLSAGYTSYPQDADNYLLLMKYATYSLEHSKLMGRNRLTVYSPEMLRQRERKLKLTEALRESVSRGYAGFSLHYQPQVDAGTKALYGAEALARWNYGEFTNVSPAEFIPILEQTGMIHQVGRFVFQEAVRQCREWCRRNPEFRISVNLSYLQLLEEDFLPFVKQTLSDSGLSPANLTLELTETCLIREDSTVRPALEELHRMGARLAMDDFGVGYSSLFSLKNTLADIIKVDQGFVEGIASDLFTATFIRAITELCHDVGRKVCMEGVETKEEYEVFREMNMDLIQGFYFGRPVSAKEFEKRFL